MMAITIATAVPVVALVGTTTFAIGYIGLYKLASGRLSRNGKITSIEVEKRMRLINEGFGGFKDVLVLGLQKYFSIRYLSATNKYFRAWSNNQLLSLLPRYAMEMAAFGSMLSAVLFLLIQYESNFQFILPILSVFAFASVKMLPAFQGVYVGISTIRGNIAAFENVKRELENTQYTSLDFFENIKENQVNIDLLNSIEFKNISFDFNEENRNILHNLSLKIKAKKSTGIVGQSGSGKSTAINILIGLLQASSGKVLVDGIEINESNLRSWQNKIGFVSQNIFLIDSSIKNNIAYGVEEEDISIDKLNQAIELAQLSSLIETLPNGIETRAGERGVKLSGGQLQRIGIARALYHDPEVIIFDEATSNLDGISEKAIMKTIANLGKVKTIIMIAHRLSTVQKCDEIFLIDDGKLVDHGTYENLIKTNAIFKGML
jgi:HlyD family secretion protein